MSYAQHLSQHGHLDTQAGTKRKRTTQETSIEEEIAWTAARCNRLLRSITSRLNTLRRIHKLGFNRLESNITRKPEQQARRPSKANSEHWSTKDPIWLPKNQKSHGQTYASKSRRVKRKPQAQPANQDSANAAFPTPFVKRMSALRCDKENTSPDFEASPIKAQARARKSMQLPVKPTSSAQEAEQGLESALENLLRQTQQEQKPADNGTHSLFASCLRQVPAYIALGSEESDDEESDEDDESDVYQYLESLGTKEGAGWSGLRDVVQSHGVQLISDAIRQGLLSDEIIQRLSKICSIHGAASAGQDFAASSVIRTKSSNSLQRLGIFSRHHDLAPSKYRALRTFVEHDPANLGKLCDLPGFWNDLLGALTGPADYEALRLLNACIEATQHMSVTGRIRANIASQVRGALIKLSVMATAGALLPHPHHERSSLSATILRLAVDQVLHPVETAQMRHPENFVGPPVFCAQVLSAISPERHTRGATASIDGALEEHIAMVARCASPAMFQDELVDFASEFAEDLVALEAFVDHDVADLFLSRASEAVEREHPATSMLQRVSTQVITVLKQSKDNVNEILLQQYLGTLYHQPEHRAILKTPLRGSRPSRFRWEAGLCQYVAATPHALAKGGPYSQGFLDAAEGSSSRHAEISYPSPDSMADLSPDILAMSQPAKKRVRWKSVSPMELSPVAEKTLKTAWVVIPRLKPAKRRTSGRLLAREEADTLDELYINAIAATHTELYFIIVVLHMLSEPSPFAITIRGPQLDREAAGHRQVSPAAESAGGPVTVLLAQSSADQDPPIDATTCPVSSYK